MGSFKQRAIKIICISSGDLSGFSGLRVAARGPVRGGGKGAPAATQMSDGGRQEKEGEIWGTCWRHNE